MNTEIGADLNLTKTLILNTSEPLIIKNVLDWELLNWDLNKWQEVLGNEPLKFRLGKNCYTKKPQFENTTDTISMTFKEFLEYQNKNPHQWLYFDYKYLREWLVNIPELRNNINWKSIGFINRNVEDSTIWIGSKGAHTPCHVDTYGCNAIAQILGRKRWILFPPDENLHPTRIPYEESSIYSSINLFTPNAGDFKNISNCRSIVLDPGDVLILPHRWWHFVENLELAISINTWIELPIDHEERIGESVALMLISQLSKQLNSEEQNIVLNPSSNTQADIIEPSFADSINLTMTCLKRYKMAKQALESSESVTNIEEILQKLKNVKVIEQLSENHLKLLFEQQVNKFTYDASAEGAVDEQDDKKQLKKVMDALLHNDVVNLIKLKLLED